MNAIIWWFGVIHLVAYAVTGTVLATTAVLFYVHRWLGLTKLIFAWHFTRQRERRARLRG